MKKTIELLLVFVLVIGLSSCGGGEKKETKNLDYFKTAFMNGGYVLEREDKPAYAMIGAQDGILFYVENNVVKIYQFKDKAAYDKAVKDFAFMKDLPTNGLFVAESSSKDLLDFFSKIQ